MNEGQVTEALIRLKFSDRSEQKHYRDRVASSIQLGRKNRTLRVLEVRGEIRGAVWEFVTTQYFPKVRARILDFALDASDPVATRWFLKELRYRASQLNTKTFIFLDKPRFKLLKPILRRGFSIDTIILKGEPRTALAALMRAHQPSKNLSHLGLDIQKVTQSRIDEILLLHRREFKRNPQYGWFCSNKRYLEHLKSEISDEIKKRNHCQYSILQNDRVVGYFSATLSLRQGKRSAGVSFAFHQSIQGRGVIKTAYRILLEEMCKRDVESFIGGTSQKSVIGLGQLMKRKPTAYILKFGSGAFSKHHFGKWS